jgi:YggT family protein
MTYGLVRLINLLFELLNILILVEVVGSFVMAARVNLPSWAYDLLRTIHNLVDPIIAPIRRFVPAIGGLDFSPMIALILLDLLRRVVVSALAGGLR